ncbi:MAG: SAM-dependent methyltransferase [Chitinophagaceae bacterium]|nr:SAM-dependent methyltransferase [Chitinophagaceae bacterium]
MKDNFSEKSATYAMCRPSFPAEVFNFIFSYVKNFDLAWDVATGNGQAAQFLAEHFQLVIGTDISDNQLKHAVPLPNIEYRLEKAEQSSLAANSADLIMVSQAAHWFDFDAFYKEVNRIGKPGAIISLICYGLIYVDDEGLNKLINHLYTDITGPYWDNERKYVDDEYRSIPFPFEEIPPPSFKMEYQWTIDQLLGYFSTWSAVQHFKKNIGAYPLTPELGNDFRKTTGKEIITVKFPVYMRIGQLT